MQPFVGDVVRKRFCLTAELDAAALARRRVLRRNHDIRVTYRHQRSTDDDLVT